MRILVNTIFLKVNTLDSIGYFIKKVFTHLAKQYKEHEFIFLTNKEIDNFDAESNSKQVIISIHPNNLLSLKYWYDIKLPLTLRSVRPDIVVQPYGYCSLTTSVSQLLLVPDPAFTHSSQLFSSLYLGKILNRHFLKKATRIVIFSENEKGELVRQFRVDPRKIDLVTCAAKEIYRPVTYAVQQEIKEQYAEGKEYFLYTNNCQLQNNLVNLLKAFSQFKKWQQSNMKLLVGKGKAEWNKEVLEILESYKHRSEVVLLNCQSEKELANIAASAYAIIFPALSLRTGISALEAMQCGAPVVLEGIIGKQEGNENAFLYADAQKPESIANQMLKLYKNESLRFRLIEEGKFWNLQFNWDKSAAMIWQSILKVNGQK